MPKLSPKKQELNVYGCRYVLCGPTLSGVDTASVRRVIVATTSMTRAAKLCGMTQSEMRNYGSITKNEQECAAAFAKPHVALVNLSKPHDKYEFVELLPLLRAEVKAMLEVDDV